MASHAIRVLFVDTRSLWRFRCSVEILD